MDRRAPALVALLLFALATVAATALDGRLPAGEDSVSGWVLQVLGHLAAIAGGVLLAVGVAQPVAVVLLVVGLIGAGSTVGGRAGASDL